MRDVTFRDTSACIQTAQFYKLHRDRIIEIYTDITVNLIKVGVRWSNYHLRLNNIILSRINVNCHLRVNNIILPISMLIAIREGIT